MAWVPYRTWTGAVMNARIRVPLALPHGIAVYGPAMGALTLRAGGIGIIRNVLADGQPKPSYVKFPEHLNLVYAVEVSVIRAMNSSLVWKDFSNVNMTGDEATVVILRSVADTLEIDDQKR